MEVKGIIMHVAEARSGETNGNAWKMQDIVVEYGSVLQSRKIVMTLGTKMLSSFEPHIGMKGTFEFSIEARESKTSGNLWNSISCYRFTPLEGEKSEQAPAQAQDNNNDLPY